MSGTGRTEPGAQLPPRWRVEVVGRETHPSGARILRLRVLYDGTWWLFTGISHLDTRAVAFRGPGALAPKIAVAAAIQTHNYHIQVDQLPD